MKLTHQQFRILCEVRENSSGVQIMKAIGWEFSKPSFYQSISRMKKKGWLKSKTSGNMEIYELTEEGLNLINESLEYYKSYT